MTSITEVLLEKNLKPEFLVAFYSNQNGRIYAEQCNINEHNEIVSNIPLTVDILKKFNKTLEKSKSIIPKLVGKPKREIVFADLENLELAFIVPDHYGKYMYDKHEMYVCYPNLLFHVQNNNLKIYVIDTLEIDKKTEVVPVTMSNVTMGSVCLGTVKVKNNFDTVNEMIEHWEHVFFSSIFTHSNSKDFFIEFNNPEFKFDYKEYYKCNKTKKLKDIITHLHIL